MYDHSESYDFNAALAAAKTASKTKQRDPQADADRTYMRRFNAGDFASEITYGLGYPTLSKHGTVITVDSSQARLARHAQKFDQQAKCQRRTGPTVKAQVLELHGRGLVPAAIADTLNMSDRRVAEILKAA
jgi:hypothetical protein